PTRTIC
ncbi:hypothetical protein KIPB_013362, partial [Kipferlia bialata]